MISANTVMRRCEDAEPSADRAPAYAFRPKVTVELDWLADRYRKNYLADLAKKLPNDTDEQFNLNAALSCELPDQITVLLEQSASGLDKDSEILAMLKAAYVSSRDKWAETVGLRAAERELNIEE